MIQLWNRFDWQESVQDEKEPAHLLGCPGSVPASRATVGLTPELTNFLTLLVRICIHESRSLRPRRASSPSNRPAFERELKTPRRAGRNLGNAHTYPRCALRLIWAITVGSLSGSVYTDLTRPQNRAGVASSTSAPARRQTAARRMAKAFARSSSS